mgnify:CR=1 FL=1
MKRTTAQRVIEAAENYVKWLDPDFAAAQRVIAAETSSLRPLLERKREEGELIAAVNEHCRAVTGRAG